MEKPVTFKSQGQQVVAVLHLPDGATAPVPLVVFLHGFRGNKQEPHRIFVKTARALCAAGIAALRVDFRGCGDSAGDFAQVTVGGQIKDARAAVRFVRRRPGVDPERVGLVGLSMGGLVAAHVLGEDPRLKAAVLWSAMADPRAAVLRETSPESDLQMVQTGVVDMDGWAVSQVFVRELVTMDPLAVVVKSAAPILLIHGEQDEKVPLADTLAYEAALLKAGRRVTKHLIAGADHTYDSIPWETEVVTRTLEWFRLHL